jgi:peptidoglycan/xylan/chitin deacetylase (PgdA/CDA1 family)
VPLLVYHHVASTRGGDRLLYVSPSEFAAQLAYLKRHGYQAVTLRTVYDTWTAEGSLPAHPVVITFDDDYVDQVRAAAPLLRRYGWPAEMDVVLDMLYKDTPTPSNCLTLAMVRALVDQGWEVESHTVSHPDLTGLNAALLRYDLAYSRKRLSQIIGVSIDFVCYPRGSYNRRVERAAGAAGYLAATSTDYAAASPAHLYALPRIYCYWGASLKMFGSRLRQTLSAARGHAVSMTAID